jgi:CheY-like chemotaxis protein
MKTNLAVVWVAPEHNEKGSDSHGRGRRSGNGHPEPPTLLVVEDEVLIRLSVGDYLRDRGYRVLEAVSAEEAQRIFKGGEAVELLFSDIDLGNGTDGLELAAWVRQHYPAVRILLASGVTRLIEDADRLCDGPFLSKPYAYEVLAAHIERALALSDRRTG